MRLDVGVHTSIVLAPLVARGHRSTRTHLLANGGLITIFGPHAFKGVIGVKPLQAPVPMEPRVCRRKPMPTMVAHHLWKMNTLALLTAADNTIRAPAPMGRHMCEIRVGGIPPHAPVPVGPRMRAREAASITVARGISRKFTLLLLTATVSNTQAPFPMGGQLCCRGIVARGGPNETSLPHYARA